MAVQHKSISAPGKKDLSCARYMSITGDGHGSIYSYPVFSYLSDNCFSRLLFRICGSKRCKTCPCFSKSQITSDSEAPIACQTNNLIYLLECSTCKMLYVGQTSNSLNLRINLHRSNIKNYNSSNYNIEFDHFSRHSFESVIIHILDIIPNFQERLDRENFFIIKYKTLVPYGLNDMLNNTQVGFHNSQSYNLFPNTNKKTTRGCRGGRRVKRNSCKPILVRDFCKDLSSLESSFSSDFNWKRIKNYIFSLDFNSFAKFENFLESYKTSNKHFHILIYDLVSCRKLSFKNSKHHNSIKHSIYFTIRFRSPIFDKIKFSNIFQNYNAIFPCKDTIIKKAFKYDIPFGRRIFNYNYFSKNINKFRENIQCFCNKTEFSDFVNNDYGHILTGNTNIVDNSILKNLLNKGSKFRPILKTSIKSILGTFLEDIDLFILKCSRIRDLPLALFTDWKWNIYYKFKEFLYSNSYDSVSSFTPIDLRDLKDAINDIQNKFIICPVDKASNNYSFVCKKLYLQLLDTELSHSVTYIKCKSSYNIISKKIMALNKLVKVKNNTISIPYITLYPKFHKQPIGFRFITCGVNTYMNHPGKIFSKALNSILDLILNDNSSWIINNNKPVLEFLKNNKVKHIESYDFKDLFTSIPLDKLKDALNYFYYNYHTLINLEQDYWNHLVNFCIFNNFIFNGENIFLQVTGIPQGCNFSSQLANLFLHFYEKNFTLNVHNAFRYIDDFLIFDYNNFDILSLNIYPSELKLIKTNKNSLSTDFLDLFISIENDSISIDIFDKRDAFKFDVIKLIYWESNISLSIYRNVLLSQLARINNICNNKSLCIKNFHKLKDILVGNNIPLPFINKFCSPLNL